MSSKSLGFLGEDFAAKHLSDRGYEIIERNFTIQGGEIDIVAKLRDVLVFVEVKTRTGKSFGTGDENMGNLKKKSLAKTIGRYLSRARSEDCDYRLDLIEVELDPAGNALENLTHFEDIEL